MARKNNVPSDNIASFLNFCRDIQDTYNDAFNRVNVLDKATQDLLHQIELGSSKDRDKAATQLAHVRRERRQYKDIVDNCEPFINFITDKTQKYDVPYMLRKLSECLGEVRKRERSKSNRAYMPRVIKQLDFVNYSADTEVEQNVE